MNYKKIKKENYLTNNLKKSKSDIKNIFTKYLETEPHRKFVLLGVRKPTTMIKQILLQICTNSADLRESTTSSLSKSVSQAVLTSIFLPICVPSQSQINIVSILLYQY